MGLYSLHNATTLQQDPAFVNSFISSNSETIITTLPNSLLSPPTYTTPPYALNTSVTVQPGEIVLSELGTSTYSPMIGTVATPKPTAVPLVTLTPTVVTLIVTNNGSVSTTVSTAPGDQATLGIPYGWTSGSPGRYTTPSLVTTGLLLLLSFVMFSIL